MNTFGLIMSVLIGLVLLFTLFAPTKWIVLAWRAAKTPFVDVGKFFVGVVNFFRK